MTIIAGAMSLKGDGGLIPQIRAEIRQFISRNPNDTIREFGDRNCFLAKIDVGAFDGPAAHEDRAGNVSLLAGEPLLRVEVGATLGRTADLEQLHDQWVYSDSSGLTRCTGTFCAVHYNAEKSALSLIGDKLGLRPLYYYISSELVIFATALRILEQLSLIPLSMSLRGATEIAVFGFPLAERTAYNGIFTIGAGQVVNISHNSVLKLDYWRWDRLSPENRDLTEVSSDTYRRFLSAIDRRIHGNRTAVAFMTGGLDSRSIVGALVERGVSVHTINYALEGTQDRVFGRDLSRALKTHHHELNPNLQGMYAFRGSAWNQGPVLRWFDSDPEVGLQRRQIWSGDGGSVGLGHVYLNHEIVQIARSGKSEAAIDVFMRHMRYGVSRKVLQRDIADTIAAIPIQGIREELQRLECADRGRAFHLFLMLNDQRRHLANLYENSDIDRLELQMPFFDSEFLEPILTSPIDGFLGHEFYMKWLENFSPAVLSVPWQTYPGHVPCLLPVPDGLRYQWRDAFPRRVLKQLERGLLQDTDTFLDSPNFPRTILNRPMLKLASWLTRLGIRNYDYLLKMAAVYCQYSPGGGRVRSGVADHESKAK